MKRLLTLILFLTLIVLYNSHPAISSQTEEEDLRAIKEDLEAIKEDQKLIKNDIQEIKTILRQKQALPGLRPLSSDRYSLMGKQLRQLNLSREPSHIPCSKKL